MKLLLSSQSRCVAAFGRVAFLCAALIAYGSSHVLRQKPAKAKALQTSDAQQTRELAAGESVGGDLRGSESALFKIHLSSGRFIRVTADKKDFHLSVSILSPSLEVRSEYLNHRFGELRFSFVSQTQGDVYLQIRSLEKDTNPRHFDLKIENLRDAKAQDYEAARASLAFANAEALRAKWDAQSVRSAIANYTEAFTAWTNVGDSHEQLQTLKRIGECHLLLSEYASALDAHMKALSLSRRVRDADAELDALNDAGFVENILGEKPKALSYFNRVLSTVAAQPSKAKPEMLRRKAEALNNTGEAYYSLSKRRKALDYFAQAVTSWRQAGDRNGEALALLNMGYTYTDLGDLQNALEHYEQSLTQWRAVGNQRGEAASLTAIGGLQTFLGEKQSALEYHGRALQIFQTIGNGEGEATTWNGMAQVYEDLNQLRAALDSYQRALDLNERIGNRDYVALSRYYVGRVNQSLGDTRQAYDNYLQGAELARTLGNLKFEAHARRGIGTLYEASGESEKALNQYADVLNLYSKIGDKRWQARTLNRIGYVKTNKRDYRAAIRDYEQALSLNRAVEDRREEVATLYNLARAERDSGDFQSALTHISSAVGLIESLRLKITGEQLRTSYFASVHQFYELNIDLLMQTQRGDENVAAALQVSERARARVLLETLTGKKSNSGQNQSQDLLSLERALFQQLNFKLEAQARLLNAQHTESDAAKSAAEIRGIMASYQQVLERIKQENPIHASLTQAQVVSAENIKAQARQDTVLLQYALGERRSYLWLATPDSIKGFELPPRAAIEDLAREVYDLLIARQPVPGEAPAEYRRRIVDSEALYWSRATDLSKVLLDKVASEIKRKRLLIVTDGVLHRIPFDALPEPDQGQTPLPIVADHEVVTIPSFSVLSALQNKRSEAPATRLIAVFANPVFDLNDKAIPVSATTGSEKKRPFDERDLDQALRDMGDNDQISLPRLTGSLKEAEAIARLTPAEDRLIATGFKASLENVTAGKLNDFRIIHFATHGIFNDENPELSGLILSRVDENGSRRNGFLRVDGIYDLNLNADLVVLSACRTGLGRHVNGEGLLGITRGFMYAGSRSVIASLWKVNDEATAELMKHFYRAMFKEGLPPSAALQAAKNAMRKQERWRAPYYWAAFVMQGKYDNSPIIVAGAEDSSSPMRGVMFIALALSVLLILGLVRWRKSQYV